MIGYFFHSYVSMLFVVDLRWLLWQSKFNIWTYDNILQDVEWSRTVLGVVHIVIQSAANLKMCLCNEASLTPHFWSTCTKLGSCAVMYLFVRGIKFVFFHDFPIGSWKWSDSVAFYFLILMHNNSYRFYRQNVLQYFYL